MKTLLFSLTIAISLAACAAHKAPVAQPVPPANVRIQGHTQMDTRARLETQATKYFELTCLLALMQSEGWEMTYCEAFALRFLPASFRVVDDDTYDGLVMGAALAYEEGMKQGIVPDWTPQDFAPIARAGLAVQCLDNINGFQLGTAALKDVGCWFLVNSYVAKGLPNAAGQDTEKAGVAYWNDRQQRTAQQVQETMRQAMDRRFAVPQTSSMWR